MFTIIGRGPLAKELYSYFKNEQARIIFDFKFKNIFDKKNIANQTSVIFCADSDKILSSIWLNLVFCFYAITHRETKFIYLSTVNSLKLMGREDDYTGYIGLDYYSLRRSFLNKLVKKICSSCDMQFIFLPIVIGKNQNWITKLKKLSENRSEIMLPNGIKNHVKTVSLKTLYEVCLHNQRDVRDTILYDNELSIEQLFIQNNCGEIRYYEHQPKSMLYSSIVLVAKISGLRLKSKIRKRPEPVFVLDQRLERYLIDK